MVNKQAGQKKSTLEEFRFLKVSSCPKIMCVSVFGLFS
jgi:hypothetical protein